MPAFYQPIANGDFTLTLDKDVHGGTVVVTSATYNVISLPASDGTGTVFEVLVGTTVTSDLVIAANGTDVLSGNIGVTTDAAGVNIPTSATSDKITMNGSTTGGLAGSFVRLKDVASGTWLVEGCLNSSGAEATPFSAT